MILKKPKVEDKEKVEIKTLEINMNLRQEFNIQWLPKVTHHPDC